MKDYEAPWKHIEENDRAALERLKHLLAIASVSTDPAYANQVGRAAAWLAAQMVQCGLIAKVLPTEGHPVVCGRTEQGAAPADAPTILFYGHYDVQPPDPVDQWTTAPFEPTVRDGAVFARGAADDKGPVCCFLEALRAWSATGEPFPCHVKVLIEGEEECASKHLPRWIDLHREALAADVVLLSDTNMWGSPESFTPAITYALRGILYYDIKLHGPDRDLHSGLYGGTVANPATILTQVLGRLFDRDRRVTIPGFYDQVRSIGQVEARRWSALGFDEEQFLGAVGSGRAAGEAGFTTLERRWARPTCDVNGLYGGYGGEGAKTIIPRFAGAKVSFRLVPHQQPAKIAEAFEAWIRSHEVHGCRWELAQLGDADPVAVPTDSPWMTAAATAIQACAGKPPVLVCEGGTVPVICTFQRQLGLESLMVGFGLETDNVHSPDEHFGLDRFRLGCRMHVALLGELGKVGRG